MTAKYAAGTCHYCHIKKIKPEMFQTHIEIKRGRSSGSWGIGRSQYGKKKRKATHLRYNAGRTYYTNKKIWCCRECYAENHPGEAGFKSKRQVRNENIKKEEERKKFIELSKKKAIKYEEELKVKLKEKELKDEIKLEKQRNKDIKLFLRKEQVKLLT